MQITTLELRGHDKNIFDKHLISSLKKNVYCYQCTSISHIINNCPLMYCNYCNKFGHTLCSNIKNSNNSRKHAINMLSDSFR